LDYRNKRRTTKPQAGNNRSHCGIIEATGFAYRSHGKEQKGNIYTYIYPRRPAAGGGLHKAPKALGYQGKEN
jgi:hypothetical protein